MQNPKITELKRRIEQAIDNDQPTYAANLAQQLADLKEKSNA